LKASAAIGTILIVAALGTFIAWQANLIDAIGGPPIQPPPPTSVTIPVVFLQYHQIGGPTPVPGETFKVEDTGASVTSGTSIDPANCPTVQLGPSYAYTFTATTYGPFPPQGIASQISTKISTPTDLNSRYELKVTCVVGGAWGYNLYYIVTKIELVTY
jgi:hypothetical protein